MVPSLGARRNSLLSRFLAQSLNTLLSPIPQKTLYGFKNFFLSYVSFFLMILTLLLFFAIIKEQFTFLKTPLSMLARSILTFIFISFVKQLLKIISLSLIVPQMTWLQTFSPNLSLLSSSKNFVPYLVFTRLWSPRGGVLDLPRWPRYVTHYIILSLCSVFANSHISVLFPPLRREYIRSFIHYLNCWYLSSLFYL